MGALSGALLAGCGAQVGGTDKGAPPASYETPPRTEPAAASARCTADRLDLALGRAEPGAGDIHLPLLLTNTGTAPCTLKGHPGVSLLTASGEPIGPPATRQAGPRPTAVVLAPGETGVATLHTVAKGVSDRPCRPPASRITVYAPGETAALSTPARSFQVCGEVFEVSAVVPN
ncbi:DUF4232 domain-containing protein [Streptomyces ficellus]|uniref:DUF4232 domain-containing protein n=1 Tax=Streptomyces ficellus TaxID=1977088 RepID=A0ABT7ZE30_9ACTN|nr:DUF4232 domain-containing protein [Streptomyces ficellus]MDN3297744.1 DUF4232 domain-containing protein [Streptomyces ficellus]